jgi:hypothetical protein
MLSNELRHDTFRVKGLLMIGGASRNVGKTSLISNIIKHFAKSQPIIGIKIKTIYEGDNFFHGNDFNTLKENFTLIEEYDLDGAKDSSGMLKAGAKRAFRLRVYNKYLEQAFKYFIEQIGINSLIVCESNSLRRVIEPDLFLMIKHSQSQNMKPSAIELEKFANKIIHTNGFTHDFDINEIRLEGLKWELRN